MKHDNLKPKTNKHNKIDDLTDSRKIITRIKIRWIRIKSESDGNRTDKSKILKQNIEQKAAKNIILFAKALKRKKRHGLWFTKKIWVKQKIKLRDDESGNGIQIHWQLWWTEKETHRFKEFSWGTNQIT